MRQIILTGLAMETDLESGQSQYFLVFNGGELRVPCEEKAANVVVKHQFGGKAQAEGEPETVEDEGPVVEDLPNGEDHGDGGTDEDGVEQV